MDAEDIKFLWGLPYDWLSEKIHAEQDEKKLRSFALECAMELGQEQILDLFEREMEIDGYYDEVTPEVLPFKVKWLAEDLLKLATVNRNLKEQLTDQAWDILEEAVSKPLFKKMESQSGSRYLAQIR
jgi:hypothetical protein